MAPNDAFVFWTSWIVNNALSVLTALIVFVIGVWLSRFLARQAATYLPRASRMDRTLAPLLSQVIHYGILVITFIVVLSQFGVQTASILAVLGAAGIAVALALQGTLSNLAAGIMLIVLRPFNIGEGIDIEAGYGGEVIEIGLFGVTLKTYDGVYIFVPNSKIWGGRITNWNRFPRRMVEHKFAIEPGADVGKVREALIKVALADRRVLAEPKPTLHVDTLVPGAVNVVWRMWTSNPDFWGTKIDVIEQAKATLDGLDFALDRDIVDVQMTDDGHRHRTPAPTGGTDAKPEPAK
jgi:small conductance mechanosensitive channel